MPNIVRELLDTMFDKPVLVKTEVSSFDKSKRIFITCDDYVLARGFINNGPNFTYVSWTIPYDLHIKIHNYIGGDKHIDAGVISWARIKCRQQGIPFVGPSHYNLK